MRFIDTRKSAWEKLDNASKIFPVVANYKDSKVYRLTVELYKDIEADILQEALDLSLESFPIYKSTLQRGFFWYYFETSDIYPQVEEESMVPCAEIYLPGNRNLLFRVNYFKKRINLEVFHALSDGLGATWFLETLVFHYLAILYKDDLKDDLPKLDYGASVSQKMDDSFWKYYSPPSAGEKIPKGKKVKHKKAYQIKGKRIDENRMRIIEAVMPVNEVLSVAREYGSSLTIFLTSLLLYSIYQNMPKNKLNKEVVLSVPINLRGYYPSSTARNFFTTMNIAYDFQEKSPEFEAIVKYVSQDFKKKLDEKNVHQQFERFIKLESKFIARITPRFLKDFFMKIADKLLDKTTTSSISNVGRFKMAKEFNSYIRQFSSCVSARDPKITFCSYGDKLSITFTSPYYDSDIQRVFFQFLSSRNIKIEISSNL